MSTLIERYSCNSTVFVGNQSAYRSRACVDVIPIRFHWWKSYTKYNLDTQRHDPEEQILLCRKTLKLRFSRERVSENAKTTMKRFAKYKRVIDWSPREANKLRDKLRRFVCDKVGLSLVEHPLFIQKILDVLQEEAVPDRIIEVHAVNLTYRYPEESVSTFYDWYDDHYRTKLIPANESFIQALEEARPPDDELECAICMEMFARKNNLTITKLPCSHYYHRDCVAHWLQINHVCPTCRHPCAPSSELTAA